MSVFRYMVCARADEAGRPVLPAQIPAEYAAEMEWCSTADVARQRAAANSELEAVWVVSCGPVDPLNLAAALRIDRPQLDIFLVTSDGTGSVVSRGMAAGVSAIVSPAEFLGHIGGRVVGVAPASASPGAYAGVPRVAQGGHAGFLLTVVSGGGGTGKSTVSVLAALLGRRRGLRVALFDGDLQFGDAAALAGPCACVPVEELARTMELPSELANEPFVVVQAPRNLEQSEVLADQVGAIADLLASRFDLVVVNTGGSWGESHALLLERSTATLFLVDQRASSVRACAHALDLCLRCGIATGSFLFAINRCSRRSPFSAVDVSNALNGAHVIELADGGSEVEELMGAGMAMRLAEGGNPLCASIDAMLGGLLSFGGAPSAGGEASRAPVVPQGDARASGRSKRKGRRARREATRG